MASLSFHIVSHRSLPLQSRSFLRTPASLQQRVTTMASPKPYASVCDELSEVQVLDSDEPLVTASSSTPSVSSARVMDSIEPLVPTTPVQVQVLDSPEPLVLSQASCYGEPVAGPSGMSSSNVDSGDLRPDEPVAGPSGMARRVTEARSSVGSSVSSPDLPSDSEFEDAFIPVPVQPSGSSGRRAHLYSDEIRSMWNWSKICGKLGTKEKCVKFAEDRGLLPTSKMCSYHKTPMTLTRDAGQVGKFRCRKSKCLVKSVSRAIETWFEDARLSIVQIFAIMYCFVEGLTHTQTKKELVPFEEEEEEDDEGTSKRKKKNPVVSSRTIADWFNYCRQAVGQYEVETQRAQGKIGGPNKVVQIDESKFGKIKYNSRQIEGHWVIGMLEDGSDEMRLEVCPDNERSADILVPLIKKHVQEGSIIHTDYWRAYMSLPEHGYIHRRVNHSDPTNKFVAPDGTHTQRIESQWRGLKKQFRDKQNKHDFGDWLCEVSWRRRILVSHLDPYEELINAIKYIYK